MVLLSVKWLTIDETANVTLLHIKAISADEFDPERSSSVVASDFLRTRVTGCLSVLVFPCHAIDAL